MSEKREIDPGDGYVLTNVFDSSIEVYLDNHMMWVKTTCKNQEEFVAAVISGCIYRRKMTSEELKSQAAKKVPSLGTAYDGSPMDLDWFINSLKPLCELSENETGIVKFMGLRAFVNNLMAKKKDQQL
jgi:hypothetical protein